MRFALSSIESNKIYVLNCHYGNNGVLSNVFNNIGTRLIQGTDWFMIANDRIDSIKFEFAQILFNVDIDISGVETSALHVN